MPNYRRILVPGGTYFFTVNLAIRGETLLIDEIGSLRESYQAEQRKRPFMTEAIVVLPDHLHAIWKLPPDDADFSTRWKNIKSGFSKRIGQKVPRTFSQYKKGEAGIWQRRFWEHLIRDQSDMDHCIHYIQKNPVKHSYVQDANDWPYKSVRRTVETQRPPDKGTMG